MSRDTDVCNLLDPPHWTVSMKSRRGRVEEDQDVPRTTPLSVGHLT